MQGQGGQGPTERASKNAWRCGRSVVQARLLGVAWDLETTSNTSGFDTPTHALPDPAVVAAIELETLRFHLCQSRSFEFSLDQHASKPPNFLETIGRACSQPRAAT